MRHFLAVLLALLVVSCAHDPEDEVDVAGSLQDGATVVTEIRPSGVLRLAPADPPTPYRRCGTGPGEARWTPLFSADHRFLAAHTNVGTVRLIDTGTWQERAELGHEIGQVDAVAFSPDGALLATLSIEAGEVGLWRTEDGTLSRAIKVRARHTGYPLYGSGLLFSRDGRQLVTSLATVIDLQTDTVSSWSGDPEPPQKTAGGFGIKSFWLVDGKAEQLLTSNEEQATNMTWRYNLSLRRLGTTDIKHFVDHIYGAVPFAVSADGTLLGVTNTKSGSAGLELYDLRSATRLAVDPAGMLAPLAFSPDQRELYTTTQNEIEVLAVPSLASLRRFRWSFRPVFLGLSPKGLLVEKSEQGTSFWDAKSGQRVRSLPFAVSELTWSGDGVLSAASSDATMLHVWNEADGRELVRLARPTVSIESFPRPEAQPTGPDAWRTPILARSADGAVFVQDLYAIHFGSTDWYSTRVYEAATKTVLRELPYTQGRSASLSADGARLSTIEYLWGNRSFVAIWCR